MRFIVASQPALSLPGGRRGGGAGVLRRTDARPSEGRRVPGIRSDQRRDPDRMPRPLAVGGRAARDGAAGERGSGRAGGLRDRLGVRAPALGDLPLLQQRHGRLAGPPAGPGAPLRGVADAAHLGAPPVSVPDRVRHQPGDADRPAVQDASHRWTSRRSASTRSGSACCTSPAWPTSRSGARSARRSRSRQTCPDDHPTTSSLNQLLGRRRQCRRRRAAEVHHRHAIGTRRLRRDAEPAPRTSATSR